MTVEILSVVPVLVLATVKSSRDGTPMLTALPAGSVTFQARPA